MTKRQTDHENVDLDRAGLKMSPPRLIPGVRADRAQMMLFLASLAQGLPPFEAARHAGLPLSYWRTLSKENAIFRAAYQAATEDFGHAMAAQALHTADGAEIKSKAGIAKAKLQADVRLKLARAYARETFGDKVDVTKRTVDVRRTEFVSYFGVRELRQGEPDLASAIGALEAKGEVVDAEIISKGPPGLGSGLVGKEDHEPGVPSVQERLEGDEPGAEDPGEEGDPERKGLGREKARLHDLTEQATEGGLWGDEPEPTPC